MGKGMINTTTRSLLIEPRLNINRIAPSKPPVDTQKLCATLVKWTDERLEVDEAWRVKWRDILAERKLEKR